MINKIKTYLKEKQEKYMEGDWFIVLLGLFMMSGSFASLVFIPSEVFMLTFLAGTWITMTGLIPIIMSVIHK
ncbi:hypothetical protein ACTJM1_25785, partial [Enterobacter hormaechei]